MEIILQNRSLRTSHSYDVSTLTYIILKGTVKKTVYSIKFKGYVKLNCSWFWHKTLVYIDIIVYLCITALKLD